MADAHVGAPLLGRWPLGAAEAPPLREQAPFQRRPREPPPLRQPRPRPRPRRGRGGGSRRRGRRARRQRRGRRGPRGPRHRGPLAAAAPRAVPPAEARPAVAVAAGLAPRLLAHPAMPAALHRWGSLMGTWESTPSTSIHEHPVRDTGRGRTWAHGRAPNTHAYTSILCAAQVGISHGPWERNPSKSIHKHPVRCTGGDRSWVHGRAPHPRASTSIHEHPGSCNM